MILLIITNNSCHGLVFMLQTVIVPWVLLIDHGQYSLYVLQSVIDNETIGPYRFKIENKWNFLDVHLTLLHFEVTFIRERHFIPPEQHQ